MTATKPQHQEGVGRYKPYPAYKDSRLEWLDEIPAHWQVIPLKRAVDPSRPVTYGIVQCGPDYPNGVPYIRPVDMTDEGGVRVDQLQRTAPEIAAAYTRSTVRPGDIVVSIGPSFGKAMIVPSELDGANLTQGTARIAPGHDVSAMFLFWALRSESSRMAWDSFCSGATFRALTLEILETCAVALPGSAEQRAIAAFLDRETTRIDALVAKNGRLIELLQEQRTALITRAVTKGLDPNVRMKDSGVEWLGEVPAHWEVNRTKFACKLRSGHTPSRQHPEYWHDCTIPWFGLADVWQLRDGHTEYVYETAEKISELGLAESSARLLPKGTVILSRTASVGFSAILGVDMATTQDFVNWICGPTLRPEYLLYVFRSMGHEFRRLTMGSTHQTIYMPDVGGFSTPIPPPLEQEQIVAAIRQGTSRIDELVAKVREAIDRLKELRSALISAAVTGKIDVREEVA